MLAVAVLFWVSFWLVSRLEQKRWMEFMRARTASAIAAGGALAFAGLGFTAVYREGFETVLFYQALALFAQGLILWVVLGAVTAALALAAVGYAIFGLGKKLPLKPMLIAGVSVLTVALRHAGRQRGALPAGGRRDRRDPDRGRLGEAAGLPRRADRHPPDDPGDRGPGGAASSVYAARRRRMCSASS